MIFFMLVYNFWLVTPLEGVLISGKLIFQTKYAQKFNFLYHIHSKISSFLFFDTSSPLFHHLRQKTPLFKHFSHTFPSTKTTHHQHFRLNYTLLTAEKAQESMPEKWRRKKPTVFLHAGEKWMLSSGGGKPPSGMALESWKSWLIRAQSVRRTPMQSRKVYWQGHGWGWESKSCI